MEKNTDIKNVNDIYPIFGDGKYQALSIAVVCLVMIPSSIHHFVMVFLAKSPEWTSFIMRNDSSSLDDLCKLNDSQWKWKAPIDYSIVSEVSYIWSKKLEEHFYWTHKLSGMPRISNGCFVCVQFRLCVN